MYSVCCHAYFRLSYVVISQYDQSLFECVGGIIILPGASDRLIGSKCLPITTRSLWDGTHDSTLATATLRNSFTLVLGLYIACEELVIIFSMALCFVKSR